MKGVIPTPDIAKIFHPTPDIEGKKCQTADIFTTKTTKFFFKYVWNIPQHCSMKESLYQVDTWHGDFNSPSDTEKYLTFTPNTDPLSRALVYVFQVYFHFECNLLLYIVSFFQHCNFFLLVMWSHVLFKWKWYLTHLSYYM